MRYALWPLLSCHTPVSYFSGMKVSFESAKEVLYGIWLITPLSATIFCDLQKSDTPESFGCWRCNRRSEMTQFHWQTFHVYTWKVCQWNCVISLRRLHLQQPKLILMLICGLSHIPVYVASFYDSTNVRTMLDAFCFHVVCPRMHPWLKFVNWICYKLLHAISPNLQLWCTSEKDEVLRFSGQKVNGPCHDKSKYGQKCTFWTLLSTQNIKCW